MRLHTLLALAAFSLAGGAFAASDHDHGGPHKPQHGGVVAKASDLDFELVAKTDVITLYVSDHGKPAATKGASGKLTVLDGAEKSETVLVPAGDNRLEAKGSFKVASGTKFVATVNLQGGKPVNVRFAMK